MTSPERELYRILEQEIRTHAEPILLDAFLPQPAEIPSALPPPPAAATEPPPAGATLSQLLGRAAPGEQTEQPAAPRVRRRPRKPEERQKSIEEEIAEFMSRDHSALAPDKDP
jgi:hypothetical protein